MKADLMKFETRWK